MKHSAVLFVIAAVLALGSPFDKDPWEKNPDNWSVADAQKVLNVSPWAQVTTATFEASKDDEPPPPPALPGADAAGMPGRQGATDGRWDGGTGRLPGGSTPTLPVLIRWDSALPVRQATLRVGDVRPVDNDEAAKDYVITLIGLVPAKRYHDAGKLNTSSNSADTVDARDPEEMLEGLMATSRLFRHGRPPLAPENVKIDGATGSLHIFFPRADPILPKEKEVLFQTRFGSVTVRKLFHLRDLAYDGRLEL